MAFVSDIEGDQWADGSLSLEQAVLCCWARLRVLGHDPKTATLLMKFCPEKDGWTLWIKLNGAA